MLVFDGGWFATSPTPPRKRAPRFRGWLVTFLSPPPHHLRKRVRSKPSAFARFRGRLVTVHHHHHPTTLKTESVCSVLRVVGYFPITTSPPLKTSACARFQRWLVTFQDHHPTTTPPPSKPSVNMLGFEGGCLFTTPLPSKPSKCARFRGFLHHTTATPPIFIFKILYLIYYNCLFDLSEKPAGIPYPYPYPW